MSTSIISPGFYPVEMPSITIFTICSWRYVYLFLCLSILIPQNRIIASADITHLDASSGEAAGVLSLFKARRLMQGGDHTTVKVNSLPHQYQSNSANDMQSMINDLNRERLVGSSPPKCVKKCGKCTPCSSVLVPIHSTFPASPTQYYPEAWRCQCKGKIYNP